MSKQEKANILGMIDERFGELVELLKKERGYTLQELSDKTNLSPSYIYRLIRGFRGCELTTKLNILLNGFGMQEEAEQYLKTVIENKETLRKIHG
ncbi:helix-turn-helix domain-containing protein [Virgibacillus dakarensis]|nr:helix-turn-helix domain-containing protein [Virgibacillus dakarensis]